MTSRSSYARNHIHSIGCSKQHSDGRENEAERTFLVSSLSTVVRCNNAGASCILQGQYSQATRCLGRAMKLSKYMIDGPRFRNTNMKKPSVLEDSSPRGRRTTRRGLATRPEFRGGATARMIHDSSSQTVLLHNHGETGTEDARRGRLPERFNADEDAEEQGGRTEEGQDSFLLSPDLGEAVPSAAIPPPHLLYPPDSMITAVPTASSPSPIAQRGANLISREEASSPSYGGDGKTMKSPGDTTTEDVEEEDPSYCAPQFVYSDPILIPEEDNEWFSSCCLDCHRSLVTRLTVVILFNMALAHHLLGRSLMVGSSTTTTSQKPTSEEEKEPNDDDDDKGGKTTKTMRIMMGQAELKKAMVLYSMSCRIQLRERIIIDRILSMAHLNNLGWIQTKLGNRQIAYRIFERLLSNLLLNAALSSYRRTGGGRTNERRRFIDHPLTRRYQSLSRFHENAIQVVLGKIVSASAA